MGTLMRTPGELKVLGDREESLGEKEELCGKWWGGCDCYYYCKGFRLILPELLAGCYCDCYLEIRNGSLCLLRRVLLLIY